MSAININRGAFVLFFKVFQSVEFTTRFPDVPISVKDVLEWIRELPNAAAAEVVQLVSSKAARRTKDLKQTMFPNESDNVLQELGTEQIRQVMRASLAFHLYAKKDQRIAEYLLSLFGDKSIPISNVNGGRYVQLVLENVRHRTAPPFKSMSTPTSFEVLIFLHSLSVFNDAVKKKKLKVAQSYSNGTLIGWCVQLVTKAWRMLLERAGMSGIAKVLAPYMWFDEATARFFVLSKRSEGFSSLKQLTTLRSLGSPLMGREGVDEHAYNLSDAMDEAMRFVTYYLFDRLEFLILNYELYLKSDKWLELDKYQSNGNDLPLVFASLPTSVTTALNVVPPRALGRMVVELDEEGHPTSSPGVSNIPASPSFANRFVLYSQIPWPQLGKWTDLKRSRSSSAGSGRDQKRRRLDQPGGRGPLTVTTAPEVKTEEEVIDLLLPASSSELPEDAKAALVVLRESMYPVCSIHNLDFRELVEEHEVEFGESLLEAVDFVLADPPYNIRRVREDEHSTHDKFSLDDMKAMVSFCREVMKLGSHGHMFCTTLQFASWHKFLVKEVEQADEGSASNSDSRKTSSSKKESAFDVESVPLHYTRAVGTYNQHPGARKAHHTNVVEQAIHFWRAGCDWEDVLAQLNYKGHGDVPTTYPWWTNVMNQITHVPVEERIVVSEREGPGRNRAIRPEQKSVAWMKDIVSKFSRPGNLVVDPCAGTFATAKACMMLPKHRRFVGCEIDEACFNHSYLSVVETFARQILNDDSDITGLDEVVEAARVFVKAMDGIAARTRKMIWEAPPGLSPTQTFPSHITHFLSNRFKDSSLFEMGKGVPLSSWSAKWRSRFHSVDSDTLLAVDCAATGVLIKKSRIAHPVAGSGVFAAKPFGRGCIVGHYYGSLVYEDLYRRQHTTKTYGEHIMAVTRDSFRKWANQLRETAIDRNQVEHPVWIVPAPFCAMRYLNDGRYLPGDGATENERLGTARENNVEFYQTRTPDSASDFQSHRILALRTLKNIEYGEELYVDYGSSYDFNSN